MSKRITASYQSPVEKFVRGGDGKLTTQFSHNREVVLAPVLKCGWDSGSAYCYIHEGDEITQLVGGFFGNFVHFTAVAVEIQQFTEHGPRFPVLIVKDKHGDLHRLDHHANMRVRSSVTAPACMVHDGWVVVYQPQTNPELV